MKYFDLIWGNVLINDKEIIKLIKHPAMQRIKHIYISTSGYLFNIQRNSTRFEHSIGVYLLLKKHHAGKKELIAGLIHDIAHTAFSHLSTYALMGGFKGEEYHELLQERIIKKSGLWKLLIKMGYKPEELLHSENFSLLENKLPDVCADRLDYAIRDGLHLQILSRQQADKILEGITVVDKEFMFNNEESAYLYAFNFYLLNMIFYGSSAEAYFNNDFGDLIKYAIKARILKNEDWFSNDVAVIKKLKTSSNLKIKKWLSLYNEKLVTYEDTANPTKVFPKKIRIVDPKVIIKGRVKRLSELNNVYQKIIGDYQKAHTKHELAVKVIRKS